LLVEAL